MAQKCGGVSLFRLVFAPIVLALCLLNGCALQRDMAGIVTDSDFEWVREGFAVKAPPGQNWFRLPDSNSNHNSVAFQRAEGLAFAELTRTNTVYIKGENVFAASSYLDKAVKDRNDKIQLAVVLRNNLERHLLSMQEKLDNLVYDASLGADCVKYSAASTSGRIPTDKGEMHLGAIHGYFCLHPDLDNFGVFLQTSAFATVWTDIPRKERQSTFFQSLRFLPVSSVASRKVTKKQKERI